MQTAFAGGPNRFKAWLDTVLCVTTSAYVRRIRLHVLNLEGTKVLGGITTMFAAGDVTYATNRTPRRVLSLTLFDPDEVISFEPDDGEMPIYLSRMVRVYDEAWVPSLQEWVGPPVFTGPFVDFDRDGANVALVAHSKDELGMGDLGQGRTFAKKANAVWVIKELLIAAGETSGGSILVEPGDPIPPNPLGGIPSSKRTLGEKITLTRQSKPWTEAVKIARDINRELVYDGMGLVHLRSKPSTARLTIPRTALASAVRLERDPAGLKNRWIVLGAKPSGPKKRPFADVRLPRKNKSSGESLGRNGRPRWQIEPDEGNYKTNKACVRRAEELRDAAAAEVDNYTFDCLPLPHLEEWDYVLAESPQGTVKVRLREATLPLGGSGSPMSFNALKKVDSFKGKGKKKRRHGGGGVLVPAGGGS